MDTERRRKRRRPPRRGLPPWVGLIFTALLATGIGIWSAGTNAYFVPSRSMLPTLEMGDQFRADVWLSPKKGPKRGEIWAFYNPHPEDQNGSVLVKRVVGLPGDTVAVEKGKLMVNGAAQAEPYVQEAPNYTTKPVKLGPEEYWVLGDNRNESHDSHAWGPVYQKSFIGRAFLRYWPLNRFRWL